MILLLTNLHAHVHQATSAELAWLRGFLTFEDESKRFRRWGGRSHAIRNAHTELFEAFAQTFPAGLTSAVVAEAKKVSPPIQITVIDKRDWTYPGARDLASLFAATRIPATAIDWLYDYQRAAVEACVARTRGIIHAPTGSGKSQMLAALTMILPVTWLVIVPEKGLLNNAADQIEKRSLEQVGRVGDGQLDLAQRVTVATYQTLDQTFRAIKRGVPESTVDKRKRLRNLIDNVQAVAYDEVHQAAADGSYRILMNTPSAFYRFGFSGTPLQRGDRRSIFSVAALGSVIFRVPTETLIQQGFVSKPQIVMVPCPQTGQAPTYQGAYGELVVRSTRRNVLAVELAKLVPKPALVFVKEVKHGRALAEWIRKAGLSCEFVWGDKVTAQREDVMRRLGDGSLDCCVCNVVFQTGIDIPELRGIVNVAGGKSTIASIQRVGRGSRIVKDAHGNVIKNAFVVYDVLDRDGSPTGSSASFIERHAKRRMRDYSREGWPVRIDEQIGAQVVMRTRALAPA